MISKDQIIKLSKLSKLQLTQKETDDFTIQLQNLLTMLDNIQCTECENVKPLSSICNDELHLKMREDEVKQNNIQNEILTNVPNDNKDLAQEISCFIVPKVIE